MELFVIWQKVSLGRWVSLALLSFENFSASVGRVFAVGWGRPAIATNGPCIDDGRIFSTKAHLKTTC